MTEKKHTFFNKQNILNTHTLSPQQTVRLLRITQRHSVYRLSTIDGGHKDCPRPLGKNFKTAQGPKIVVFALTVMSSDISKHSEHVFDKVLKQNLKEVKITKLKI